MYIARECVMRLSIEDVFLPPGMTPVPPAIPAAVFATKFP